MKTTDKKGRFSLSRRHGDWICAYAMIAPLFLGLALFYLWPFFQSIYMSFTKTGAFNQSVWIGGGNYVTLFTDRVFYSSFGNTLLYTVITVPVGIFLAIILASLLNAPISGRAFYRTVYFLPSVTMAAAIALVWRWIFNGDYGLLNALLGFVGIPAVSWLTSPSTVMLSIGAVGVWSSCGYNAIILLAGLQGINSTYYDAARIDGAGPITRFARISLPLLSPSVFFVSVTGLIGALKTFDVVYMMVPKSSPAYDSAQTVLMYFYRSAFEYVNKGYASTIAAAVFVVIMGLTVIQLVLQKRWVVYD